MKKIVSLLSVAILLLSTTGCVSTKKIRYFQGADSIYAEAQRIMQQYEMRLKPADQIYVKVTCSEPELLEVFRQGVVIGSTGQGSGGIGNVSSTLGSAYGFTIDNEGYVNLPKLGQIKVAGKTMDECAKLVEQRIKEKLYIADPEVTVRLLNARVTVIGAVGSDRVVSLTSERNTIIDVLAQCGDIADLDILSQCGDIADTGLRQKLTLYREENGQRQKYDIDLTKADVFQSPAYYVQQNDLIYVEPNKSKSIKASPFYTFMGAGTSIMSAIMSAISLIFLIKKR